MSAAEALKYQPGPEGPVAAPTVLAARLPGVAVGGRGGRRGLVGDAVTIATASTARLALVCLLPPGDTPVMDLTYETGPSNDDLFAVVREIGEVNRLIREGLAAWHLTDAREVFRERLAAVELGDSPARRSA